MQEKLEKKVATCECRLNGRAEVDETGSRDHFGLPANVGRHSKRKTSKPWMRKVWTSSRHLLAEIRAIHGTYFFRNKNFLFVKIQS